MEEYIKWLENKIEVCLEDKDLQREHWAFCQALNKYRTLALRQPPVSSSFTKDDIDSLSREEYRCAQQIAIDFAKWINIENIDMRGKDTWHHPYEDVNREINSKELFELFLENYY